MNLSTAEKLDLMDNLIAKDPQYREMLLQCGNLEKRFDAMVKALPKESQDLAWDFVMLCEDISRRALEIACKNMEMPRG